MSLYQERLDRIQAAVALEPVDKVPVISGGTAFNAQVAGITVKTYIDDLQEQIKANIYATQAMGNVDGVQGTLFHPGGLAAAWYADVRMPGQELPDNELWQIEEPGYVKQEDYDLILEMGFNEWQKMLLGERMGNPLRRIPKELGPMTPVADKAVKDAGFVNIKGTTISGPMEAFCGGRTLVDFLVEDLLEIPEKVEEVFDKVHEIKMQNYEAKLRASKPMGAWIGLWRGTPSVISPEMFETFSWKYVRELAQLCLDCGVIPIFHCDSCWDKGLKYFREMPKGKCILALDGQTDIFLAKEVVGDHMCIMGDVPAALFAYGSQEDNYNYCRKLCTEIGPTGFLLSSGCDIPFNGKLENVQMMAKAADDCAKK
ncbi:MAG: uroporphyrinogen decarboxylase [Oscillospiraceae bacterium]|nr:uroporphyrinogen decarboxylase [Oscillospiraceae bacterium]